MKTPVGVMAALAVVVVIVWVAYKLLDVETPVSEMASLPAQSSKSLETMVGDASDVSSLVTSLESPLAAGDSRVLAPTLSAPTLSLEGVLESSIRNAVNTRAARRAPSVASLASRGDINPEQKQLTADQEIALAEMIAQFEPQLDALEEEKQGLTLSALLEAVASGRLVTQNLDDGFSGGDSRKLNVYRMKNGMVKNKESLSALARLLGKAQRDWSYMQVSTHQPDNVARSTIVHFTRAQHPDVFSVRQRMSALDLERERQAREFFSGL